MKRIIYILIVFSMFSCKEFNFDERNSIEEKEVLIDENVISNDFDFLPTSTTSDVYKRNTYVFSYSEDHEQSEWVAYYLDNNDVKSTNFDRPFFEQDPLVESVSADWRNYKNSGYDKGHLCPAGDRKGSYDEYNETFFTSNISPQEHDFNSGVWNRLEEKVRYWAVKSDGLFVVTGGVLSNNLKTIGKEDVSVPNYFYKVLLSKDGSKMIGFLVPHENSNQPLYEFVVSVDEIEKMTGIDFYPNLPDEIENRLESKSDYKDWSF
ncbi:DNA/RNA non-specific endonuclease [Flavobacterium lacisediminis]|uniref:DNA/RNA non-specific endonuclease n=1 Tax=Flavobacterium lacisediminis TaxID=2989705 RepID=A0ABT3EHN9_9FLAO|nr:DNA/RNA non-specific endonuclease [Flavobacterium lacisediminis]MCW1148095.1 DNA/RNA non-specific endonuclease [Flavobacterium lacisediminis]